MSERRRIPDGEPFVYGRDYRLTRWTVRKQPNGTWAAKSPAPYRPHPYVYDTWQEAYDFAAMNGDPLAAALRRIQRIARLFDVTGDEVRVRDEAELRRRPPVKKPSTTPPQWAIDVGAAKRDPRSSRRVK